MRGGAFQIIDLRVWPWVCQATKLGLYYNYLVIMHRRVVLKDSTLRQKTPEKLVLHLITQSMIHSQVPLSSGAFHPFSVNEDKDGIYYLVLDPTPELQFGCRGRRAKISFSPYLYSIDLVGEGLAIVWLHNSIVW